MKKYVEPIHVDETEESTHVVYALSVSSPQPFNYDHILHVHVYPLQFYDTPLHHAATGGHTTCMECLLSAPGVDVNIKDMVSSCLIHVV